MEVILLFLVSIPVSKEVHPVFQLTRDIRNLSNYTKTREKRDGGDLAP
jgi:hypothetical protein